MSGAERLPEMASKRESEEFIEFKNAERKAVIARSIAGGIESPLQFILHVEVRACLGDVKARLRPRVKAFALDSR